MTQREHRDDGNTADVYETPATSVSYPSGQRPAVAPGRTQTEIETTVVTPVDRVRWGSIVAGIFTALSTMLVLTLIGLAIGAAPFVRGDRASGFGIGAGIWSAV